MNRITTIGATCALAITLTGCATFDSVGKMSRETPRFYTGTRLNIAALQGDRETLDYFRMYEMTPAAVPLLDLPMCAVLDTVLLPYTAGISVGPIKKRW